MERKWSLFSITAVRWSLLVQVITLLLLLLASTTNALKECIQPVRMHIVDGECVKPQAPEPICFQETCGKGYRGSDACTLVTYAILADFEVFDVVLLHEGTCQAEIPEGTFTKERVEKLLPRNDELVGIQLNGTDLLQSIEHGLDQSRYQDTRQAYPRVAGVRFRVDFDKPYGHRVSQAEIMTLGCRWKAVNLEQDYNILTSKFLAEGGFGYGSMTRTRTRMIETGIGVTDSFWFYAHSTCNIMDPFQRPKNKKQQSSSTADKKMDGGKKTIKLKAEKQKKNHRSNRTVTAAI